MWFIIHLSTVVVALLFICGTEAKPQDNLFADTDWSDISKGCIRNNNYKVVGRPTMDSCKEMCVNEDGINCQSIEYNPDHKICGISEARSDSEHFMETCYEDGWEYTERIQAAGGESCSDNDRTCRILAEEGECQKHTSFMKNNCKKSCNYCPSDWCTSLSPPGFWIPTGTRTSEPCRIGTHSVTPPTSGEMRLGAQCCQPVSNILVRDWCTSLSPPGFWIVAGTRTSKPCPVGTHSVSGEIRLGAQCCQPVGNAGHRQHNFRPTQNSTFSLSGETSNGGGSCSDSDRSCSYLASIGECQKHTSVRNNCKKSCNNCPSGTQDLCSEMEGSCIEPKKCNTDEYMEIYNQTYPIKITKKYCGKSEQTRPACCAISGKVFTVDIENALAWTFDNTLIYNTWEFPDRRRRPYVNYSSSLVRDHLRGFLGILDTYLIAPEHIQTHTKNFIHSVVNHIPKLHSFNAVELQNKFIEIQNNAQDSHLSAWQPSVSCHNINPTDCYEKPWLATCGLWNMFHTMTVAAAQANAADHLEVIEGIRGFMLNLFFCGHCRYHFRGMYTQTIGKYKKVKTLDDAILWLWCAHNSVNEAWPHEKDHYWPPHPRFPLTGACPDVWNVKVPSDRTDCSELFCNGTKGDDKCFAARTGPDQPPLPRDYPTFSKPKVLTYLKKTYAGSYNKLNANPSDPKLIFDVLEDCPHNLN